MQRSKVAHHHHRSSLALVWDNQMQDAQVRLWRELGTPGFFQAVLDVLEACCPVDSCGILVFYRKQRPLSLAHRFHPFDRSLHADIYSTGPYALDPQYQLFLKGCPSGPYWLADVAPDDFYQSSYYTNFYSKIGVADSIDVLWRIDDDSALNFFMQRNINTNPFCRADLQALQLMMPLLDAALARHHQLASPLPAASQTDQTHAQVESTLDSFASSLLTPRERDVLWYLLRGYSSALTAEKLQTSDGTVKIHRKNIYRKLEIGSQAELFSLFINCIPYARPGLAEDPLQRYQQQQGTAPAATGESITDPADF
jgi:DNA-binding CsgD family transcriptional regulator